MQSLLAVEPAQVCQAFFILAATGVLAVAALPNRTRQLLVDYGARDAARPARSAKEPDSEQTFLTQLAEKLTSWGQVPHSWFLTFYVAYLASASLWALQYLVNGRILHYIAALESRRGSPSMTLGQVRLAWALMVIQALRRLYEQAVVMKKSTSKMWFVHLLLGLSFYLFMSVAIWIEGSQAILHHQDTVTKQNRPPAKAIVGVPVFLMAWAAQYWCHAHLTSLTKYSLPEAGVFRYIVCPHYTCECVLYLLLAVVAAPEGRLYNQTLLCALGFVSVNLGVTAKATRRWYAGKFGAEKVAARWTMIPLVF